MGNELVIEMLMDKKNQLLEELKKIDSEIVRTREEKDFLHGRVLNLGRKHSELAKKVLEDYKKSFNEANEVYETACLKRKTIINELKELEEKLKRAHDNPTAFIEEKAPYIAKCFWDYVGKNMDELGQKVQVFFVLHEVTKHYRIRRFDGYDFPTGNVGIREDETNEVIVYTNDFPYSEKLYEENGSPYTGETYVQNTQWYNSYLSKFAKRLYKTLEETNPYKDTFTIKYSQEKFVLELV